MAANTDDMLRQLVDAIDRMRYSSSVFEDSANRGAAAARKQAFSSNSLAEKLEEIKDRFGPLKSSSEILRDNFDQLRQSAMANGNREQVAANLRMISQAQNQLAFNRFKDSILSWEAAGTALTSTFSNLSSSAGSLITSFQQGSDAISTIGKVFESTVGLASDGVSSLAKSAGSTLSSFNNKYAQVIGGLISGVGEASKVASFLAKGGFSLLTEELKKTVSAFTAITNAGALYADGLSGMRDAAKMSSLTLAQFSDVVKSSSAFLSELGIGIAPGARKIGEVLSSGADAGVTFKNRMLNLGFSFEEQGVLIAEVMRDMRQSGGLLRADAPTIQRETERYAQNLRVLSAITGEDARKRMDQARQAANTLAFQQKLATMDETQRKNVVDAMANMSELQQRNFMDTVLFGTVINREGAAAAAMSQSLTASVNQYASDFTAGKLTPESVREGQAQFGEAIKKELLGLKEIGLAAAANVNGLISQLGQIFEKELDFRRRVTPEAIKAAEDAAAAQRITSDKLTTGLNNAQVAAQKFAIILEAVLSNFIPTYSKLIASTFENLLKMLHQTGVAFGLSEEQLKNIKLELVKIKTESKDTLKASLDILNNVEKQAIDKIKKQIDAAETFEEAFKIFEAEIEKLKKEYPAMITGSILPGPDTGKPVAVRVENFQDVTAAQNGNVLSGPRSGYLAMLHGTEAVIPLPDGRSVPVTVKSDNETMSGMAQNSLIEKLVAVVGQQTEKYEQMLQINNQMLMTLVDSHRVSREILNNTYT